MYILYAHHNDSYIKMSASTFSLVASLTSFCNALYLRAVLIRYLFLSFVLIQKKEKKKKSSLQIKSYKTTVRYAIENEWEAVRYESLLSLSILFPYLFCMLFIGQSSSAYYFHIYMHLKKSRSQKSKINWFLLKIYFVVAH